MKVKLQKKDVISARKSILNGKFYGHDNFSKEFYEHFWDDLKVHFINSLKQPKIYGGLPISHRQAIVKLLVKKTGAKYLLKTDDQFCYLILTQKYYLNHSRKN